MTDDKKVISIGYSGYSERMNCRPFKDSVDKADKEYYAGDPYNKLECICFMIFNLYM